MGEEAIDVRALRRMKHVVRKLKTEHRELLYPLCRMKLCEEKSSKNWMEKGIATDGLRIFYCPDQVWSKETGEMERRLAHMLCHGLLGHFEIERTQCMEFDWQVMDAQAERMMTFLGIPNEADQKGLREGADPVDRWGLEGIKARTMGTVCRSSVERLHSLLAKQWDDHSFWHDTEGQNRERTLLWDRAREILMDSWEEQVMAKVLRQRARRLKIGWEEAWLEALLQDGGAERERERLDGLNETGWWRLTDYLCELLVKKPARETGETQEDKETAGRLECLLAVLETAKEKEILEEKIFYFVMDSEPLLRAVSRVRAERYLELCSRLLEGMGENRYIP